MANLLLYQPYDLCVCRRWDGYKLDVSSFFQFRFFPEQQIVSQIAAPKRTAEGMQDQNQAQIKVELCYWTPPAIFGVTYRPKEKENNKHCCRPFWKNMLHETAETSCGIV